MRNKIIIGNWKMNKNSTESLAFIKEFSQTNFTPKENLTYGIAMPSINILAVLSEKPSNLEIAAQDVSKFESGAYTGEVSAKMLKHIGLNYVIVGHSERRQYHGETSEDVNLKSKTAIANGLTPIICVGETLEEYESNRSKEVLEDQIVKSLNGLDLTKIVVAYEPVWAIGTGKTATFEYAQDMCKFIRSITGEQLLIQYGGSVNGDNINELLNQADIDGALVGGASLEVASFVKLIQK
ncbi:MAG: triose-phosphate isomerase [Mycoplasma sp.]